MRVEEERGRTEHFRWKTVTRHTWLGDEPIHDADGSLRVACEGDWIEVVYARDGTRRAFIETVERATAQRTLRRGNLGKGAATLVTKVALDSAVGRFEWETDGGFGLPIFEDERHAPLAAVFRPGRLTLPDGRSVSTTVGTGLFDAPGLVRAHQAWRDEEIQGGWKIVTDVSAAARDEWRPILAAFPLLLFPQPPSG